VGEAPLLMPVQRVVGRIEIEDDRLRRYAVRFEEEVHEQAFDRPGIVADLVVAARHQGRVLEPVERALAGEWRAIPAPGGELAGQRCQHRVMAQLVVIDQVLVAERDAEHSLRHHRLDRVLDLRRITPVGKARREPPEQTDGSRAPASEVTSPPSKAATT
jgi:hypothetical protein